MKAREWKMFAHEIPAQGGGFEYHHCGPRQYVEMHGLSYPVVQVILKESKRGKFLGWIETGKNEPVMVWHERIFEICFAYGSKVEVDKGRGKVVRLEISKDVL